MGGQWRRLRDTAEPHRKELINKVSVTAHKTATKRRLPGFCFTMNGRIGSWQKQFLHGWPFFCLFKALDGGNMPQTQDDVPFYSTLPQAIGLLDFQSAINRLCRDAPMARLYGYGYQLINLCLRGVVGMPRRDRFGVVVSLRHHLEF